jgi:hypothetical protein
LAVGDSLLVAFAGLGAGGYFGGWHAGLAGTPAWTVSTATAIQSGTVDQLQLDSVEREAARVARNHALGAVTALLLGLVGGVIGGWLASGEPMNFTHYRTRQMQTTRSA